MVSGFKPVDYRAQPVIKVPEFKIDNVSPKYILTIGDRLLQIIRTFFGIADNSTEQLIKNRINDCKSYLQSNQIDDAIKNLFNVYELLNGKSYFSGLGIKNKISLKFNLDDNSVYLWLLLMMIIMLMKY